MGSLFTGFKLKFADLVHDLDERARRRWAATEARSLGRGGITAVSQASGICDRKSAKEFANSSLTNLSSPGGNAARVAGENDEPRSTPAWRRRWIGSLTR